MYTEFKLALKLGPTLTLPTEYHPDKIFILKLSNKAVNNIICDCYIREYY